MDRIYIELLSKTEESLKRSNRWNFRFKSKDIAIGIYNALSGIPSTRKFDFFFWTTASLSLALEYGYLKTQNPEIIDVQIKYYNQWIKVNTNFYLLDQIMNGYPLISLNDNRRSKELENLIHNMYKYIDKYPRTSSGSLPYRINKPEVVLVDYLGMICPFLSRYGSTFNCEKASSLAGSLIQDFLRNGMDVKTSLPYHGFRSDNGERLGIIGWGRGVGWLLIGMVDTLAFLDRSSETFWDIINNFKTIIDSIIPYQDEKGYFKWLIAADKGHIDTSATAMIGYSIKRAIDLDFLNIDYKPNAKIALEAIINSTREGQIFDSSAECQGIGEYPQRYEWNRWGQGFGTAFALTMVD